MKIQKLNWAGIKIDCGKKTVLIDAVENFKPYFTLLGDPLTPVVAFSKTTKADYILFTHLHLDHYDIDVIRQCLKAEGKIICHRKFEKTISKLNMPTVYLDTDESFRDAGILFKPVFSMDGIGETQTAWIAAYDGIKIFHGGDTIWHNQFWKLGKDNPGIDYAFLPVNGPVVDFRMLGLEYSTVPVSLTPEQAFNAAKLLHAKKLIPIHYKKFSTKNYCPTEVDEKEFNLLSKKIDQDWLLLEDGMLLGNSGI